MKRIHLLPNLLTALSLTCGLYVIFRLNMTFVGGVDEKLLIATSGILLLAALFDLLDGAVARAINATSEFGGFFDSMSDAVTFGVAPSVIILKSLSFVPGTFGSFVIMAAALIYSVSGVMRLVRYNVTSGEEVFTSKTNFIGLPIPAAASAAVSLNLMIHSTENFGLISLSEMGSLWTTALALIFLGYLMISHFRFASLKNLQYRVRNFQVVFAVVIVAVLFFYGIIHHFPLVYFVLSWGYVTTSLFLSILRWVSGRRIQKLENFEMVSIEESEETFDDA